MRSPTRRNRNIGTAKQGHGQNNRMVIPDSYHSPQYFFERLENVTRELRTIQGQEFTFLIEPLRPDCYHPCSVNDLEFLIQHIDIQYFTGLNTIVFRQPKRKEHLLSSVWGRLIYDFNFPGVKGPAIVLEACENDGIMRWPKRLSVRSQYEIQLLADDGHEVEEHKRYFLFRTTPASARNHTLYHTFFHELGHHWHYHCEVLAPAQDGESADAHEQREDRYFALPKVETERFAIDFGLKIRADFEQRGLLPFPPQ